MSYPICVEQMDPLGVGFSLQFRQRFDQRRLERMGDLDGDLVCFLLREDEDGVTLPLLLEDPLLDGDFLGGLSASESSASESSSSELLGGVRCFFFFFDLRLRWRRSSSSSESVDGTDSTLGDLCLLLFFFFLADFSDELLLLRRSFFFDDFFGFTSSSLSLSLSSDASGSSSELLAEALAEPLPDALASSSDASDAEADSSEDALIFWGGGFLLCCFATGCCFFAMPGGSATLNSSEDCEVEFLFLEVGGAAVEVSLGFLSLPSFVFRAASFRFKYSYSSFWRYSFNLPSGTASGASSSTPSILSSFVDLLAAGFLSGSLADLTLMLLLLSLLTFLGTVFVVLSLRKSCFFESLLFFDALSSRLLASDDLDEEGDFVSEDLDEEDFEEEE